MLFKKTKGPPDPVPVRVDVTWGDPVGRRVRLAARSNDGETVRTMLEASADAHEREFLLYCGLHGIARAPWIEKLPESHPEDATSWLVRGAHSILWAWQARGGEHATNVSAEAEEACRERLEQAERDLVHATRLSEDETTAWSQLVVSGYGLGIGFEEICNRFDEADQRVPWLHLAHHHMLEAAARVGSQDTIFAFSRDVAARAPDRSPCLDVIPLAHLAKWRAEHAKDATVTMAAYLTRPDVAKDIDAAAKRSVEASAFDDARDGVIARNVFAMVFLEMGDLDRARAQLTRIGDRPSDYPWRDVDPNPGLAYARARQRVGLGEQDL